MSNLNGLNWPELWPVKVAQIGAQKMGSEVVFQAFWAKNVPCLTSEFAINFFLLEKIRALWFCLGIFKNSAVHKMTWCYVFELEMILVSPIVIR